MSNCAHFGVEFTEKPTKNQFSELQTVTSDSKIFEKWCQCLDKKVQDFSVIKQNSNMHISKKKETGSACPSKTECISIASNIACSCHDIPEKLLTWHQETIISPPIH
jgi:hypothetical protein